MLTHPSFLLMQNRSCKLPNSIGSLSGWGSKTCQTECVYLCCKGKKPKTFVLANVRVLTRVWLSTKVTSAQKLEMDMAIVFPLKPSEGFPITPTLPVTTQSKHHKVCKGHKWDWNAVDQHPTWHKSDTWWAWQDGPVAWWSSEWATWCSQGDPDKFEANMKIHGAFKFQPWQQVVWILCKDFYLAMQQRLFLSVF